MDDCGCDGITLGRLARIARAIAGIVSLAAAAWWSFRALLAWRRPSTLPAIDPEFGLRVTPLAPDERAAALDRELDAGAELRL